jgi:hypothetical protein
VAESVQRTLDALLLLRGPDGSLPDIGDGDGGWLLPLTRRAPGDSRGVFATAAALFGRPDYAWAAGGATPEIVWLLGPEGLEAFDSLAPAPPAGPPSRLFADGGYAVMASGWNGESHRMIFDVGPLGCPISGGHGHADLLSVQCAVFGEPYVVDPGTGVYADKRWRDFFRGSTAHSTLTIDGQPHAEPAGPFAWKERPRASLRRWLTSETFDFADAEHRAYGRLPDPVLHRRRVLFVRPRYWIIVDDLDGTAQHRVDLRFQFAPMAVQIDPWPWVRARGAAGHGLLLRTMATVPLAIRVVAGQEQPPEGWVSPDYGRRVPAPMVVHTAITRLPLRILSLVLPLDDASAAAPDVDVLPAEGVGLDGIAFRGGQSVQFLDDGVVILRP